MINTVLKNLYIVSSITTILMFLISAPTFVGQTTCPNQGNYAHWPCGSIVYYKFDSTIPNSTNVDSEMQQIIAAFNTWNSENSTNNSKIHFEPGLGGRQITIRNDTTLGYYVQGGATPTNALSISNAIEYDIAINPDSHVDSTTPAFGTGTGYDTAYYKLALHEIGHTMGLGDVHPDNLNVAHDPCTQETKQATVMNNFCGTNDHKPGVTPDNIPLAPTSVCDTGVINNTLFVTACSPEPSQPGTVSGTIEVCQNPYENLSQGPCQYGFTLDSSGYYCCRTGCTIPPDGPVCLEQKDDCEANGGLWKGCCKGCFSPIVIDIAGNGFNLTDGVNGVDLDVLGDGTKDRTAWTAPGSDDAWLALDRNHNGTIDNALELFGNFTEQPDSIPVKDRNGFLALAVFDQPINGGNNDGKINRQDRIYNDLRLWQDLNHNGISEPNELRPLTALDVRAIFLDFKESRRADQYNNRFKYRSRVRDSRDADVGKWAWDVFLVKPR